MLQENEEKIRGLNNWVMIFVRFGLLVREKKILYVE
jgi:hypothetical protein